MFLSTPTIQWTYTQNSHNFPYHAMVKFRSEFQQSGSRSGSVPKSSRSLLEGHPTLGKISSTTFRDIGRDKIRTNALYAAVVKISLKIKNSSIRIVIRITPLKSGWSLVASHTFHLYKTFIKIRRLFELSCRQKEKSDKQLPWRSHWERKVSQFVD